MRTQASARLALSPGRLPMAAAGERLRKSLLVCGIVSSFYYAAITVYVPTHWPGYSSLSRAVSELSAVGAPTRGLWLLLAVPYTLMVIAFGAGVWMSAADSRSIRTSGALLIAQGIVGAYWPPMHLRGVEPSLTDTLHIGWAAAWLVTMLTIMAFAAFGMGRRFRLYTVATLTVFVAFGTLTWMEAGRLASGLPTPHLGLWERINMAAAMLWVVVLASVLLTRHPSRAVAASRERPPGANHGGEGTQVTNVASELEELAARLEEMASRRSPSRALGWSDARVAVAAARNIRAIPEALAAGMEQGFALGRELGHREVELAVQASESGSYANVVARQAWGGGQTGHA
jgi:hypothetical protein